MTHAALFNGIGGFQLAAAMMGWENTMSCEIDDFCNTVTKYHFPNCKQHKDVRTTDFTIYRGLINILTGGFPCQPYSQAGKRKGKEDERHLWPEMLRAIIEIQPDWVVGENVRGLINWNGGLVFDEVQADLEAAGYEVFPFLLPAAGVDAPHERYRIWFVAHAKSAGMWGKACGNCRQKWGISNASQSEILQQQNRETFRQGLSCTCKLRDATNPISYRSNENSSEYQSKQPYTDGEKRRIITNTSSPGLQTAKQSKFPRAIRVTEGGAIKQFFITQGEFRGVFDNFPTQSPVCNGDDGISTRLDGITFSKWRNESIKAGGNAIVPQVVLQIFKAIESYRRQVT